MTNITYQYHTSFDEVIILVKTLIPLSQTTTVDGQF